MAALTLRERVDPVRAALVWSAGVCWLGSTRNVCWLRGRSHADDALQAQALRALQAPVVWWLLSAVTLLALVAWMVRWRQGLSGAVAFAGLWLGAATEHGLFPGAAGVRHGKFLAGAALFCWLVGYGLSRGAGRSERERVAHEWAAGAVGALYTISAIEKLLGAGPGWGQHGGVAMQIAAASSFGLEPLRILRAWAAVSSWLPPVLAAGTLVVELSGALFVWPALRPPVAWLTATMHLGVVLLLDFHYLWVWSPLVFALAYGARPPVAPSSAPMPRSP